MNEIQLFQNKEFGKIRTLSIDNEPYFVGKDVADILGYQNGSRDINRHTDEEDKEKIMMFDGNQDKETIIINASGLYSLILSSKMPTAKKFKHWVTSEVLPTIRKHGMYATDELLDNPDLLIGIATKLKEERALNKVLYNENAQQKQLIGELKPKADYVDDILKNKGLVTITQISKDYGMSGQSFNTLLHDLEVQYLQSKQWLLYSKYHNCGYTHSETIPIVHSDGRPEVRMLTKWTQKGRLFIYDLLKSNDVLPTIEQEQKTA